MLKLWQETRFLNPRDNLNLYSLFLVGWVEATKPFDYRSGTTQHNLVLLGFAIVIANLQLLIIF